MKELLEFLNEQNGMRLLGYGILLITILSIIFDSLSKIFILIINGIKNKKEKNINNNI